MVRATRLVTQRILASAEVRRAQPGADLVPHLVHAVRDDGTRLENAEIVTLALDALVGGNETTTNLLGGMLLLLLRHPDALDDLRADPSLAEAAVEESPPARGLRDRTTFLRGSALARLEARITLEQLIPKLRHLRFAPRPASRLEAALPPARAPSAQPGV